MPDTPPVVTDSFCSSTPFAMDPLAVAAPTVPFIPTPFGCEGSERSEDSMRDIGKESDVGDTKALACAAVVGNARDSMLERC